MDLRAGLDLFEIAFGRPSALQKGISLMVSILDLLSDRVSETARASRVADVRVGAFFTVVAMDTPVGLQAGLAATLGAGEHQHEENPPLADAGRLLQVSAADLVRRAYSSSAFEAAVGLAALNALISVDEAACVNVNAGDLILERGAGRRVAMVGHFPFVPAVRQRAERLDVLELETGAGDLPAERAPDVIPQADVVAITGSSLLNHTFDDLIPLCPPEAFVLVLGGSTPLSPIFFDLGVDVVAGTRVGDIPGTLATISQGGGFRQIPGKRLLAMMAAG